MTEATQNGEQMQRFIRRMAWATLVPVGMMIAALVLKPMWRDEFWSLYFSEPRFGLMELINGRMHWETHPPLYFIFLTVWRDIMDNAVWIRMLALPFLAVGVIGAYLLGRGRRELALFLMLCAGSYWVIYFATEARPYTLLFVVSAWSTLVIVKLMDREASPLWFALWAITGALVGMTHFFGALWVGCTGLAAGIGFITQRRYGAFVAIGIASIIAILPLAYWLYVSMPMLGERGGNAAPPPDEWQRFMTQLMRGLTVKLLGSNLAITCAAFAGLGLLLRKRGAVDLVLLGGALLFVLFSAGLDIFWSPMIKERAFLPMIPALIFVMTRAVLSLDPARPWAKRFLAAAPIVAVISPFLFIPEYFKDREKLLELHAYLRTEAGECAGSPVVAYMRERWGENTFMREVIDREMRLALPGREPRVYAPEEVTGPLAPNSGCRLRAVALLMLPGEDDNRPQGRAEAREALRRAGVDPDGLEEVRFGKGRNVLWVVPDTASAPGAESSATP